jgi:hypothetical protein
LGCLKAAVDHAIAIIMEFAAPDLVCVRIAPPIRQFDKTE